MRDVVAAHKMALQLLLEPLADDMFLMQLKRRRAGGQDGAKATAGHTAPTCHGQAHFKAFCDHQLNALRTRTIPRAPSGLWLADLHLPPAHTALALFPSRPAYPRP